MGSGNKREIINTLERAVSSDFNRMQSMAVTSAAEYQRWLVNRDISGDFYTFPGEQAAFTALPGASDFLIAHDCISGLMVRPDNAGSLIIDPGEAAFFVPAFLNATGDDSLYVRVSDVGVQSLGVLTWTANGGAGTRWDIVECQPTEALLESASRDIYVPATGQFTPTTVQKVRGGQLTYRIRLGTPAGGVPAIVPDWMPLAAIHTRTDSTGFLDSDVYDIRPLVSERCPWSPMHPVVPPSTTVGVGYRLYLYEAEISQVNTAGVTGRATGGYFRGHFGGYWSGGRIRRNTPSGSAATFGLTTALAGNTSYFNAAATENRSSSYAIAGDDRFTLGAFFPRGYPRWVRYSQVALTPSTANRLRKSGRLPQGPRGILMISKDTGRGDGIILPANMPTAFAETTGAWGHVVCEGVTNGTADFYAAVGGTADKKFHFSTSLMTLASGATPSAKVGFTNVTNLSAPTVTANFPTTSIDYTIARSYPCPPYARAVLAVLSIRLDFPGALNARIQSVSMTNNSDGPTIDLPFENKLSISTLAGGGESLDTILAVWVPLYGADVWDDDSIASTINRLTVICGTPSAPTFSLCTGYIAGYQL